MAALSSPSAVSTGVLSTSTGCAHARSAFRAGVVPKGLLFMVVFLHGDRFL
jgi:hypothetical protein